MELIHYTGSTVRKNLSGFVKADEHNHVVFSDVMQPGIWDQRSVSYPMLQPSRTPNLILTLEIPVWKKNT